MHIYPYLKAVFILLLTFVLTALFMLMLYGVQMFAFPKHLKHRNGICWRFNSLIRRRLPPIFREVVSL